MNEREVDDHAQQDPGELSLAALLGSLGVGEQLEITRDPRIGRFDVTLRQLASGLHATAHLGESQVLVYDDCDLARILRELLPVLRGQYAG